MKRLAVYGTLREGGRLKPYYMDEAEALGEEIIEGFDMFSIGGSYPAITTGEGKIKVEIYELEDSVAERITRMEEGANYICIEVDTRFGKATMYYMDKKYLSERNAHIESGDWIEYVKQLQPAW